MNYRTALAGLAAGFVASLMLTPGLYFGVVAEYTEGSLPPPNAIVGCSYALAALCVAVAGAVAAGLGGVRGFRRGAVFGGLAGLVADSVAYPLIIAPAACATGSGAVFRAVLAGRYGDDVLVSALSQGVHDVFVDVYSWLWGSLVVAVGLGALAGGLVAASAAKRGVVGEEVEADDTNATPWIVTFVVCFFSTLVLATATRELSSKMATKTVGTGASLDHLWMVEWAPLFTVLGAMALSSIGIWYAAAGRFKHADNRQRIGAYLLAVMQGFALCGVVLAVAVMEPVLLTEWPFRAALALCVLVVAIGGALSYRAPMPSEDQGAPISTYRSALTGAVFSGPIIALLMFGVSGVSAGLGSALGPVTYITALTSGPEAAGTTPAVLESIGNMFAIHMRGALFAIFVATPAMFAFGALGVWTQQRRASLPS